VQIFAEAGVAGFYRGCITNLLRTTPAAAVTFTSFELINRYLRSWAETGPDGGHRLQSHLKTVERPVPVIKAAAEAGNTTTSKKSQHGGGQEGEASDDEQTAVVLSPPFATATGAIYDPKKLEAHIKALDDGNKRV
jgi:Mitochondrial carrier protein